MGKLKIRVDQDKCIGSGQCVYIAPAVFDQREQDGIVMLLNDAPDDTLAEEMLEAARGCPSRAITIEKM